MRWPFHFGRAARAEGNAAPSPAAPPQRRDWASLAPIQRSIGDAPLTAPSLEFSRSLAGSEEPPLHLETLGHHRTPDGPQGLVMGIANPIESYAPTTELVGRPRRRSEMAISVQAAPEGLPSAIASGTGSADSLEDDSAPDLLSRVLPAVTVGALSAPVAISRLTDATAVELGALRPVQRSPETDSAAAETSVAAHGNQPPPAPPAGTRLSLGLSRRHGLGAPIRSAGMNPVQRSTAPLEVPPQSPAGLPAGQEPRTAADPPTSEPVVQPAIEEARSEVAGAVQWLPRLPIARRQGGVGRSGDPESPDSSEAIGAAPAAEDIQMQASPSTQLAPAIGAIPISIQRIAGMEPARPGVHIPTPTSKQPTTTPTVPLTSLRPSLASVRLPGETALLSLPLSHSHSPETFGEMPQPAVQRSAAAGGAPVVRAFQARESNPLVWNLQRQAPGESPGEEPITSGPSAAQSPSPGAPMMAAAPASVPSAGAGPASGGAEGVPQPGLAPAAAAGGPGTAPTAGAAAAPHGEKELHELAQALFHPLMSMVRREVLVERERAGFVTDLR